jgi:hypothetical protein
MANVVSAFPPFTAQQTAGSARPYQIDLSSLTVNAWQANAWMAANALIRPTQPNQTGYIYQTTAAGQTGEVEPAWPKTGSVSDGSLTWAPLTPPQGDSISSVAWTQINPPDGMLTITGETHDQRTVTALIGGGTSGNTYTVQALVTMASGAIYPLQIVVSVL